MHKIQFPEASENIALLAGTNYHSSDAIVGNFTCHNLCMQYIIKYTRKTCIIKKTRENSWRDLFNFNNIESTNKVSCTDCELEMY